MSEMRSLNEVSELRPQFAGNTQFFSSRSSLDQVKSKRRTSMQRLMRTDRGIALRAGEDRIELALEEALNMQLFTATVWTTKSWFSSLPL